MAPPRMLLFWPWVWGPLALQQVLQLPCLECLPLWWLALAAASVMFLHLSYWDLACVIMGNSISAMALDAASSNQLPMPAPLLFLPLLAQTSALAPAVQALMGCCCQSQHCSCFYQLHCYFCCSRLSRPPPLPLCYQLSYCTHGENQKSARKD